MRTIPREVISPASKIDPVETTRRLLMNATKSELEAYILGALHDATYNRIHRTWRFSQSNIGWLKILQLILGKLGFKSWLYREGKERFVWILETTAKINPPIQTDREKIM